MKYLLCISTNGRICTKEIEGDALATMQSIVGGYIEKMPTKQYVLGNNELDFFANDEGLLKGLPINGIATQLHRRVCPVGVIVGDVAVAKRVGMDSEGFTLDEAFIVSDFIGKEVQNV